MRSLIVLALLAVPALADPHPTKTPEAMHTDDCARARAKHQACVIDMGGEKITGTGATGGGIGVGVIETGKEPSLVKPRKDFIVEIIRSAEDL